MAAVFPTPDELLAAVGRDLGSAVTVQRAGSPADEQLAAVGRISVTASG